MNNTPPSLTTSEEVARAAGSTIQQELRSQGHTLEWLADEVGVTVDTLLKGFTELLPYALLMDIAEVLGVRTEQLYKVPA
jgi:lambda repressor-like predicted transcriptional regulator